MKNIITIIKKEFERFFKDKRMVITTILLPGLMIFIMYSFMGQALSNMMNVDEDYIPTVYIYYLPDSLTTSFTELNIEPKSTEGKTVESIKEDIKEKTCDLLIVFPTNFDELVSNYDIEDETSIAPNIEIFYNSTKTEAQTFYNLYMAVLENYENTLANSFDINKTNNVYDLASEKDVTGQLFSMMLPMLMMMFIFSGCMAIAPESIAGEKERGTIATLLVTPIKRSELAIGKIFSLSSIALLSGISSFVGTIFSLPKLMGGAMENMNNNVYAIGDYLMLLAIILSSVLIIISMLSIISAFAKSVKEATTLIMPLMIVVMLIGVSSMFGNGATSNFVFYMIPLYNSVQSMNSIFSFEANPINILITIISNLIYSGLLAFLLTRMFMSEKVMFSK